MRSRSCGICLADKTFVKQRSFIDFHQRCKLQAVFMTMMAFDTVSSHFDSKIARVPLSTRCFLLTFSALRFLQSSNNGSRSNSDTEGRGFGSGVSPVTTTSGSRWSEAGGDAPRLGSPMRRSHTEAFADSVPEDQGSAFHFDTGEEDTATPIEQRRTIVAEQDRATGLSEGGGQTMTPRRPTGNSNAPDRGIARVNDDAVVQVLPRDSATAAAGLPLRDHTRIEGDQILAQRGDTRNGPSIGTFNSDSDEWAVAGPDDGDLPKSQEVEARSVSKVGGTSSDHPVPTVTGQRQSRDRTPRMVTVSVKPRRNQRPAASISPQEESTSASPQRPGFLAGNTNNTGTAAGVPRRCDVIDSSEASPTTPGFTAVRGGIPSVERPITRDDELLSSGGDGTNVTGAALERLSTSSRAQEGNSTRLTPGPSAPVAAASQLGLEGEGFPDVSDFDLDDISEIDAGGEWAGSDGGASLSS